MVIAWRFVVEKGPDRVLPESLLTKTARRELLYDSHAVRLNN